MQSRGGEGTESHPSPLLAGGAMGGRGGKGGRAGRFWAAWHQQRQNEFHRTGGEGRAQETNRSRRGKKSQCFVVLLLLWGARHMWVCLLCVVLVRGRERRGVCLAQRGRGAPKAEGLAALKGGGRGVSNHLSTALLFSVWGASHAC